MGIKRLPVQIGYFDNSAPLVLQNIELGKEPILRAGLVVYGELLPCAVCVIPLASKELASCKFPL